MLPGLPAIFNYMKMKHEALTTALKAKEEEVLRGKSEQNPGTTPTTNLDGGRRGHLAKKAKVEGEPDLKCANVCSPIY